MGEVISGRAEIARIDDHVRKALRYGLARGNEIAQAADSRLAAAIATVDSALALHRTATETEATAWAALLAEDAKSDVGIGAVRDEMWNALGRPRQSAYMDQVFPGGVSVYTSGDPRQQPVLMQILKSRILSCGAPQWTDAMRTGWAAQIEALRAPYETAVATHRPAEAAAMVGEVGYRTAVRTAHARLRAFKRDLQSLGLSVAQIFEIIPDASSNGAGSVTRPNGTGTAPVPVPSTTGQ